MEGPKGTGKSCSLLYVLKKLEEKENCPHLLFVPSMDALAMQYYQQKLAEFEGEGMQKFVFRDYNI